MRLEKKYELQQTNLGDVVAESLEQEAKLNAGPGSGNPLSSCDGRKHPGDKRSHQGRLCVCIHSAIRCLSARLPYRPHIRPHFSFTLSGTLRNTELNISWARSTDSSIARPVGITRTFTCLSRAKRMPAMRHAPRYTIPLLKRGMLALGSNISAPRPASGASPSDRSVQGRSRTAGKGASRRTARTPQ